MVPALSYESLMSMYLPWVCRFRIARLFGKYLVINSEAQYEALASRWKRVTVKGCNKAACYQFSPSPVGVAGIG